MENKYYLLKDKPILEILNGDTTLGKYTLSDENAIELKMPYLSGPNLCDISKRFGLPVEYGWRGGALSRWQYLSNLIDHCAENNSCSRLLAYLFRKESFSRLLSGQSMKDIDGCYNETINAAIDKINGILYFGNNELVKVGDNYVVKSTDAKIFVDTPEIKIIDREYIKSISSRALADISDGNYDSAITKSRTLLEEVFCYVIEKKNEVPDSSGNIQKLYKQVRDLYNMHTDKNMDKRINTLLSGLSSIITSIAEMRNKNSDSHGVGSARINIADYHALLFVNSSIAMADFVLSVHSNQL
ncbi:abortive phage infection protein [Tissierellia bacterium S5-A11]|nr:abortive phage infection protein [Tissierellia bacterium S5-A11]